MANLKTYRHSGEMGPLAIPLALLYGGLAAMVGGLCYQLLIHAIPYVYMNLLIVLVFGFVVGLVAGNGMRRGKLRNMKLATLLLIGIGALAVAASFYVGYEQLLRKVAAVDGKPLAEVRADLGFMQWIQLKVLTGWKIGKHAADTPISGKVVYFVWAIEAAVIITLTVIAGRMPLDHPFCERTGEWMTEHKPHTRRDASAEQIKTALSQGNLADVLSHKDKGSDVVGYILFTSPDNQGPGYVTVRHARITTDKNGNKKTENVSVEAERQRSDPQPQACRKMATEAHRGGLRTARSARRALVYPLHET